MKKNSMSLIIKRCKLEHRTFFHLIESFQKIIKSVLSIVWNKSGNYFGCHYDNKYYKILKSRYWVEFQVAPKTHNSSNTVEVYFLYMVQCWSSKHVSRDPLYSHWDTQVNRNSTTFNMCLPTLSWGSLSFQTTEKGREYGEVCISGLYGSLLNWLSLVEPQTHGHIKSSGGRER